MRAGFFVSPGHGLIDNRPLFHFRPAEVDARGLDAAVAHQVGQEGDVVASFQEVLGEEMPEGVGMDHLWVDAVFAGEVLELLGDTAR